MPFTCVHFVDGGMSSSAGREGRGQLHRSVKTYSPRIWVGSASVSTMGFINAYFTRAQVCLRWACPWCFKRMPKSEEQKHQEECEYRRCSNCNRKFLKEMFTEHYVDCPKWKCSSCSGLLSLRQEELQGAKPPRRVRMMALFELRHEVGQRI